METTYNIVNYIKIYRKEQFLIETVIFAFNVNTSILLVFAFSINYKCKV